MIPKADYHDAHNRYRSRTVAFRVSPEEAAQLEIAASLSGMLKQDYYISKLLDRTIIVQGSCKVHKALFDRLTEAVEELRRIEAGQGIDDDLMSNIELIASIVDQLYIKRV